MSKVRQLHLCHRLNAYFMTRVVYHLPKNSGNLGQNVNGRAIWLDRPENFRNKRNVLKGSPKFPTEISEWKMCLPFAIFSPLSWNYDQVELVLGSLDKLGVVVVNGKWPIRTEQSRSFAYHLHKPLTNRFLLVNGKQPEGM